MTSSYTTVASARNLIGNLFQPYDFVPYLNRAVERIINSGLWDGSIGYAAFTAVNEFFTLPYEYLAVIGAQWFRAPVPVFGQLHDFIAGGPGQPILGLPPQGIVEDLGNGYATMLDPPTAGSVLKITLSASGDTGSKFRLYGTDANGSQIFDSNGIAGLDMTVTYPSTTGATVFATVTGIQVPVQSDGSSALVGSWTLSSVAPDTTVTQIGSYYPSETFPQYRRYRIGITSNSNTQVPFAVTVLVRRRFIAVYKETDWVIPGNLGALTFAMQAIDTEGAQNDASHLWAKCFEILNQELHAVRGSARPEMNWEGLGSLAGFDNVY